MLSEAQTKKILVKRVRGKNYFSFLRKIFFYFLFNHTLILAESMGPLSVKEADRREFVRPPTGETSI